MLNSQQIKAANKLKKALDACHAADLEGGVYESKFRIWPCDGPKPYEDVSERFFDIVEQVGLTVDSPMRLDGGSGW